MQEQLIQAVADETNERLAGRFLGKIFQLSRMSFAFDFGLRGTFLFVSAEPASPRFYLIERKIKELDKQAQSLTHFGQFLRAQLGGGKLTKITKHPTDRIVRLQFEVEDDLGAKQTRQLVVQLTGKAANLLLLDQSERILGVLRAPRGKGQAPGEHYQHPPATAYESVEVREWTGPASAAADSYFQRFDADRDFATRSAAIQTRLRKEIARKRKLRRNLEEDLLNHGDPNEHKRLGDLLLANILTASREGRKVLLTDYYSEGTPTLEIEIDEETSIQDEAAKQFRQYTKAKRAREGIAERLTQLAAELRALEARAAKLDDIIKAGDETNLGSFEEKPRQTKASGRQEPKKIPGIRQYVSSDGYEVLVGRTARDNDTLTFRVARPHDLWFHAGDYAGSHVIVRNPTRKDIPQRTLIEAAQLAGRFSQASEDSKVVVHYTQRKFLSKPKGAAPGLVRMSSFRSITVEPKESIARMM